MNNQDLFFNQFGTNWDCHNCIKEQIFKVDKTEKKKKKSGGFPTKNSLEFRNTKKGRKLKRGSSLGRSEWDGVVCSFIRHVPMQLSESNKYFAQKKK